MIDSAPITTYVVFLCAVLTIGLPVGLALMTMAFRETRSDRIARHESIPAYYGRLHFAH